MRFLGPDSCGVVPSKNLGDPFRRFSVPQWWMFRLITATVQSYMKLLPKQIPITPYQDIRANGHSDWALGVLAQSKAWRSQKRGLLLNSARVRYYNPSILLKCEELKVPQWLKDSKAWVALLQTC